jgi:hypothetical protein
LEPQGEPATIEDLDRMFRAIGICELGLCLALESTRGAEAGLDTLGAAAPPASREALSRSGHELLSLLELVDRDVRGPVIGSGLPLENEQEGGS